MTSLTDVNAEKPRDDQALRPRDRILLTCSVAAYAVALLLPSYSVTSDDRKGDFHQIGIQSLFAPDDGFCFIPNGLYLLILVMAFQSRLTPALRKTFSSLLGACMGMVWMTHCFGDRDPQSHTRISYDSGAFLWAATLILAALTYGFSGPRRSEAGPTAQPRN